MSEAMKTGLKHLISAMYKAEAKAYEKGEGEKPKPIPKKIEKDIKEEKKTEKKGSPVLTEDMRKVVRGFFQQATTKSEPKVADLYVGRGRKRQEPVVVKRRRRRKKA